MTLNQTMNLHNKSYREMQWGSLSRYYKVPATTKPLHQTEETTVARKCHFTML